MKKAALLFVFLVFIVPAFYWAAAAPNPNDYPIIVHVRSSQRVVYPGAFSGYSTSQKLGVVIEGKKYELESADPGPSLLALGDYKAKLIKDEHKTTYESFQIYELLFPDQTTARFTVVGQSE